MRCTGTHNFLSAITFTPLEKHFLANGLRFIPTPSTSRLEAFTKEYLSDETRGWPRFARTLENRLRHDGQDDDEGEEYVPKFALTRTGRIDRRLDDDQPVDSFLLDQYRSITQRRLTDAIPQHQALVRRQPSNHTRGDAEFIDRLMKDPAITCKPADKNLGLVLVDTTWYDAELKRMLSDKNTYAKFNNTIIEKGTTVKCSIDQLKTRLALQLQKLVKQHQATIEVNHRDHRQQIIDYLIKGIPKSTAKVPGIYLLIKVHKPKVLCGRPIVPCTRWITTPASVVVDHMLQGIIRSAAIPWLVKDTKSLVNELECTSLAAQDGVFITADIASLYTNIDTTMGLDMVRKFLAEQAIDSDRTKLIMDLLSFVMLNSYLTFKDQVYHQVDGTAMGTSAAPTYANVVVFMLEKEIMKEFTHELHLYRRFLDDVFVYIDPSAADRFRTRLNQLHPKLVFEFTSHPTETAFLDLHIHKGRRFTERGVFDLRVHQKAMNLYLYIPYSSFHTDASKRSFIQTELMRYIRNSSDRQDYIALKRVFFQRLRDRGYPPKVLLPIFNSIFYSDRAYFLYPSADLLQHPTLYTHPPTSLCLLKRMARVEESVGPTGYEALSHSPVFVIPFTPLSKVVPTRQILMQAWDLVTSSVGCSPPIIAYQSCPSLLVKLVHQKAREMERERASRFAPPATSQQKLVFRAVHLPKPPAVHIELLPDDGPAPMEITQ